ncbi:hypothetical protein SAMN02990966_07978 [Rhodospirillales bacterium URHD0017]|nr:hypothetical protein SAMN02990966_07978 [Rhodospirillales bacterium URHD0017]
MNAVSLLEEAGFGVLEAASADDAIALLIRFHGQLTENDFVGLDKLASDTRGKAAFDCIFDMTGVEKVELSSDFVVKRGDLPQAYKGHERIYVVPQDDLKLLVRFYAASQGAKGWKAPFVVATLDDALRMLSVDISEFEPFPPTAA